MCRLLLHSLPSWIISSFKVMKRYQVVYSLYRDWLTIVRVSYDDCKAKASHAHLERTGDRILTNLRYHHNGAVATKSRQPRRGQNKNKQRHDVKPRKAHDEQSRRICSACGFGITTIGISSLFVVLIFYSNYVTYWIIHYRLLTIMQYLVSSLSCIFTISRPLLFISDITCITNTAPAPSIFITPMDSITYEPAKHFISCPSCLPYFLGRLSLSIQSSVLSTSPPTSRWTVGDAPTPWCKL